jgi:hypothetical protein
MAPDGLHREDKLVRKHIFMNEDDWKWIEDRFGGKNKLGTSKAIRIMLRKYREAIEAKESESASRIDTSEIQLEA